jgi:hypothetical protein
MKPVYEWRNIRTGEVVEHDSPTDPPGACCDDPDCCEEKWQRVFAFGVGRVEGAGSSPPRASA